MKTGEEQKEKLRKLIRNLNEQDNRCTDRPLFLVQRLVREYGYDPDFTEDRVWIYDGSEVDEDRSSDLEEEFQAGDDTPHGYVRTGYRDRWEYVQAFLTEQGAKDYLEINGHNVENGAREVRIYADSTFRNEEIHLVQDALMSSMVGPPATPDSWEEMEQHIVHMMEETLPGVEYAIRLVSDIEPDQFNFKGQDPHTGDNCERREKSWTR